MPPSSRASPAAWAPLSPTDAALAPALEGLKERRTASQGISPPGAAGWPPAAASKIITRLVVGDVGHGRTYSYRELRGRLSIRDGQASG
jgi:hypothetical protein